MTNHPSILLLALAALSLSIAGCCGASSPSSYGQALPGSCSTYDASCQKSCSFLAAEEGTLDVPACVQDCRSFWLGEGVDPSSCCPNEQKTRTVCDIECSYEDSYWGSGSSCMPNCLDGLEAMTGLGPDDCAAPY